MTNRRGLYFEEFAVGDEIVTPGRTITESDVVAFAGLSGDYNSIHTDETYAAENSVFGRRVAHGLLGLSIVEGLKLRTGVCEDTALASLEWSWRFTKPIFVGDTVHAVIRITETRATSKSDRGIVREHVSLLNQNGEVVSEGDHVMMMKRKPAA